MAIAVPAKKDPDATGLSPADFRAKCTEQGGPCSVEMGQENVIALLLQQQEEVLREIRDQKKVRKQKEGLALSQKNKQEIARLVLSSLKKQRLFKLPVTSEPSHHPPFGQHSAKRTRTAPKRTSKKRTTVRHRRHSRSSRDQDQIHQSPQAIVEPAVFEGYFSSDQNSGNVTPAVVGRSNFALENVSKASGNPMDEDHDQEATTLIRQRVEKHAEHVEVSLDGAWLPSLSPSSGLGSPGTAAGRRKIGSSDGVAATGDSSLRAALSHAAVVLPFSPYHTSTPSSLHAFDAQERYPSSNAVRPGTVDSQSPSRRALSHHLEKNERGSVRAGKYPDLRRSSVHDGEESGGSRGFQEMIPVTDNGDDDGCTPRSVEAFTRDGTSCRGGDSAAVPKNISQDTATMLKRSHALVARAKACCGQAARSSTADHGERGGQVDIRPPPRCQTTDNSPSSGRHRGGRADSVLAGSEDIAGTGEAGGILFATSSWPVAAGSFSAPRPLGVVKEEEGKRLFSPPASAGTARGRRQEHATPADAEIGGSGAGSPAQRMETEPQPAANGGMRDGVTTEPDQERREAPVGALPEPLVLTDEARTLGVVAADAQARHEQRQSVESAASSAGGGSQGRGRGGSGIAKARKRRGQGLGGPKEGDDGHDNPAKVDTEWENEIAKNILSLYQTKLKADLDMKKDAEDDERTRRRRYLTIEEEEEEAGGDLFDQEQRQRCSNRAATATPWNKKESHPSTKPGTAAAAYTNGEYQGFGPNPTKNEASTPARARGKGGKITTPSSSSRRAVTAPTKPREVVVGRDYSLGRQTPSPPVTAAPGAPGAPGKTAREPTKAAGTGRGGFRGNKAIVVQTRGGGEAVVVVPKRPRPIWFAGSGAIQAEWSALPGGARVVRDLEGLEEQGRYSKYVAVVEGLLTAHLRADDQRGPGELVKKLWRQLVATCIAFGVRSTEQRRFERALELLKRAGVLLSRQVLEKRESLELRAFVHDAYGLYFLRRGKSSAALDYVQKAMKTHARMGDWGHVAKCHLHSSVVLSKLNRHDEALRCLGQVLSMVQDGKLDVGGNSPQKLCLVAICYHNMAVEQLILRHAGEACMSSQNARRLARLCLSYSNRWLHSFEGTHKLALAELARTLPSASGAPSGGDEAEQGEILKRLTEELFS